MSSKHPLATILGDGVIAGITTWAAWRFIAKPLGKGISHLGYRWRRFLAPIWLALWIELFAVLWHWMAPWYWPVALVLPVMGGTAAILGPRLSAGWSRVLLALVPDTFDAGRKGVLDRVPERVYAVAVLTYLGTWLALRVGAGASPLTTYGWWVGLLGFGGTWWWHRRVRTAGLADRYARRWRVLSDPGTGPIRSLHRSRVVEQKALGKGMAVLVVRLAAGTTIADISSDLGRLCSFFSLRNGAITIAEDETNARRVVFKLVRSDPWKGVLPHALPVPGSFSLAGLKSRIPIGVLDTGEEDHLVLRHLQIIGKNGSGKTVAQEGLLIYLTGATDCQVVASDMASGATLNMWKACFPLPLATTYEDTLELLERVCAEIERREAMLGTMKAADPKVGDSLTPSPECPTLVFVIDELPKFVGEAATDKKHGKRAIFLLNMIGQQGRKVMVRVITAAQNGSKVNMGAKELQAQMSTMSFHLNEHASRVLWGIESRQGWSSSGLKIGQYLLQDDEHTEVNVAKGRFASPEQRRVHVAAVAKMDKLRHPVGIEGLFGEVTRTEAFTVGAPEDAPTAGHGWVAPILDRLGDGDAHWEELAKLLDVARPTIFRYLKQMQLAGLIHKVGRGKGVVWRRGAHPDGAEAA